MWPFGRRAKKLVPRDDSVWFGYDALCAGVGARAAAGLRSGKVLLVVQFPESLDDAEASLTGAGGACERLEGGMDARGLRDAVLRLEPGVAALVHSAGLREGGASAEGPGAQGGARPGLSVIVWERHPLRIKDDRITAFVGELGAWFEYDLRFNAALDRPPVSMFAGEATRSILERLGMKATDSIEHSMLSKSVERAQAKVAEKTSSDPKPAAASALEWL